jgi:hypothetical protein
MTTLKLIGNKQKMTDEIFSKFVLMSVSLRVDANWMQFFFIDSLDVTSRKYMFNIFLLLNMAKIEKKLKWNQNLWNILFDILNGPVSRQFNAVFEPTGFLPLSQEFQPADSVWLKKPNRPVQSGRQKFYRFQVWACSLVFFVLFYKYIRYLSNIWIF